MTCHITRPSVSNSAEAFTQATAPLPRCKTRDHTALALEYPETTAPEDIAAQLQSIPGLRFRVSGHRAMLHWKHRQGLLRKFIVKGRKPEVRTPPPLSVWFGLGSEITNMDNHLSTTRFVDTLPVVEVQQIRARAFLAEFDADFESVRSVLDTLPSIDPDIIWEARLGRPTKVLILRGRNRPRHRALKEALRGTRLFLFKNRPTLQAVRRAQAYWTNARSEADWDDNAEDKWSCPETADSSASSRSA